MENCVESAIERNSDIKNVHQEEIRSINANKIALSSLYPSLGAAASAAPVLSETALPDGGTRQGFGYNFSVGINASYGLINPGREESIKISKVNMEITELSNWKKYYSTIASVKSLYYSSIRAVYAAEIHKSTLSRYMRIYDKLSIEYRMGRVRPLEISSWEVTIADAKLNSDRTAFESERIRENLFRITGVDDKGQALSVDCLEKLASLNLSQEELLQIAENNSPEILIAKKSCDISKLSLTRTESSRMPSVNVSSGVGYSNQMTEAEIHDKGFVEPFLLDDKKKNWQFGLSASVSASMPLYTGGRITAEIERSKSDLSTTQINAQDTIKNTNASIIQRIKTLQFLWNQISISEKNIKNAETNYRIVERSYENGLETQTKLAEAAESLKRNQLSLMDNKIEYLQNLTALAIAVGINEELLCSTK